jgi:hypothetical protein
VRMYELEKKIKSPQWGKVIYSNEDECMVIQ